MIATRTFFCGGLLLFVFGCDGSDSSADADSLPEPASEALPAAISVERIVTGATISGANGIHFGPDGLLYVASVLGSEIVVLDPDSGEVKRRISKGVTGPDDVAFSSDGSFYWTSILTGEVAGMRPDGNMVIAARLAPGVNPITFSSDDRLFVAQCFFDDKLYEIDPDGVEEPRLISEQLGPDCGLNGMDWGPDDRLYGPRWFRGEVVSFDVDALDMRTEASGFEVPAAVKFDSKGRLHVLDTAAGTVVRMDGEEREILATFAPGLDNFAFDAKDRLFVSSFVDGYVARVDEDGSQHMLTPGGLAHPGGLTLRTGVEGLEVVVADLQSVRSFDAVSGESTGIERNVFGVSEIGSVTNIAADGANLILTSWLDGTVKIWDPVARRIIERYAELAAPVSAIRYEGRIVVTEHGRGRVIAIGAGDARDIEVLASGLTAPTGLAVRDSDLFLSDRARGEILQVARDGAALEVPEIVASGLSAPEGIAATRDGFLAMDGDNGRLMAMQTGGEAKLIATFEGGSPAPTEEQPPSMLFNGVVANGDRVAFVTGETGRALYRVRLD